MNSLRLEKERGWSIEFSVVNIMNYLDEMDEEKKEKDRSSRDPVKTYKDR
jgi:hypothetical protein